MNTHTKIDFSQFTNDQLDTIYEKTVGYKPIAEDGQTREQAIELIASYEREHGVTIPSQIENSPQGQKAIIQVQQSQHTPELWHIDHTPEGKVFIKPIPGQIVCEIEPGPDQMKHARLISLAPEMLELVKQIVLESGQSTNIPSDIVSAANSLLSRARQ